MSDLTPPPDADDTNGPGVELEASETQVVGLRGTPIEMPAGQWLAQVDADGALVREDGLLVKVREAD